MSAGDVTFIGWTGSSPLYKELEPQVSYEPGGTGPFIQRRVMRRLICFSADKDAVLGTLPTDGAAITSVYLDAAGAVQTLDLGGGWDLIALDAPPFKTGFFLISAVYAKDVPRIFTLGLPTNLSITCTAGVASIRYKTTTLETFTSGTGACGSGLQIVVEKMAGAAWTNNPDGQNEAVWWKFSMALDGVRFDAREVLGHELRDRTTYSLNQRLITQSTEPTAEELAAGLGPVDTYSSITHTWKARYGTSAWQILGYRLWSLPAFRYRGVAPLPRWKQTGNTLQLLIEDAVWKQWDVTGL